MRYGGLRAGERVLIQAAAGGVGIAATQVAKLMGAEVYGTASPAKHDAIRGFGVDHPVDYRTHDVVDEVRRIAGEREPLDLVFDAIGGRSFKQSFSLLRPGGRLVCFGASEIQAGERRSRARALRVLAQMPRFNPVKLMSESKSVIGLNMLGLWDAKHSLDEYIAPLADWVEQRLHPPGGGRDVPAGAGRRRPTATCTPARTSARWSWSPERLRARYAFRCDVSPHRPASSPSSPPSGGITRGGRQPQAQGEHRQDDEEGEHDRWP